MNDWLKPKGITSIILMVGALAGAIVVTATYITLPKDVEAMQEDIVDLKQIIQSQQTINDFYYQREQVPQDKSPYCEWENDEKWCWDDYYQEWWRAI